MRRWPGRQGRPLGPRLRLRGREAPVWRRIRPALHILVVLLDLRVRLLVAPVAPVVVGRGQLPLLLARVRPRAHSVVRLAQSA